MKRVLIIVVAAFIILAGGAVTAMYQMKLGPLADKDAEAAAAQAEKAKPKEPAPPRFVNMDPIVLTIFDGDKAAATIQFEMQIETTVDREPDLSKKLPKVRDEFIRDLHGYLPRLLRDKKRIDVSAISRRLEVIGERGTGKGLIDAVLITNVLDRRL